MISALNVGGNTVNALLRQQTERQALQAEQRAQALENQAAAKRREARQADATARKLDAEADQATAQSSLLQRNISAADQQSQRRERVTEQLSTTITQATRVQESRDPATRGQETRIETPRAPETTPETGRQSTVPSFTNPLLRNITNTLAGEPRVNSGTLVNLQV